MGANSMLESARRQRDEAIARAEAAETALEQNHRFMVSMEELQSKILADREKEIKAAQDAAEMMVPVVLAAQELTGHIPDEPVNEPVQENDLVLVPCDTFRKLVDALETMLSAFERHVA